MPNSLQHEIDGEKLSTCKEILNSHSRPIFQQETYQQPDKNQNLADQNEIQAPEKRGDLNYGI